MRGWTAWPPWRRPIARTPRAQDDDGGEGTNSSFSYTVTADGRYTVRANSYDGSGRRRHDLEIRIARGAP
jgi:hypothetical protein